MADQKSWLWRKKPSEKNIVVIDKVDITPRPNEQEIQELLAEKAVLENNLRDLTDRLSYVISENSSKDELARKHAKTAQDALLGWEKAEAKALSLKQELDEALEERERSEDKIHHLDAALKECMTQLRFVREDQERRIHDVLLKASGELEETKVFLEDKLAESGEKIAEFSTENSRLNEVLFLKDKLIGELTEQLAKADADMKAVLGRMRNLEKDNSSLLYEVRVLEKEVDIRNEEREFNRRASDAAHKQHLENVRKIAKLESECQRLRVLVRKRLPGPAAVAKMKTEVGLLQRESMGSRRNRSNSGYIDDGSLESPVKKINFLTSRISTLEEENYSLRETLTKKVNELQVYSESVKGHMSNDVIRRSSSLSQDLYSTTLSDVGSDDKVSCTGSWASALVPESEVKDKISPSKMGGGSEINHLMNDFLEMEKLALVCVDKPDDGGLNSPSETTGKELVPVPDDSTNGVDGKCDRLQSDMSSSISKLIELIEGIGLSTHDDDNVLQYPQSEGPSMGYLVRVFQWKTSELAIILQKFQHICEDLLNGRTNFEKFTQELTSSLEWILNHCFSLQDVSCMKDEMKKKLGFDDSRSESEVEVRTPSKVVSYRNEVSDSSQESEKLKKLEQDCELLRDELGKSEANVASLEAELKTVMDSKVVVGELIESCKMNIEDLNSQMRVVMSELEETKMKLVSKEEDLKNKGNYCDGLESKCRDLELQLERVTKEDIKERVDQDEKQLQTERDISAASEKLVECQETIIQLGNQIKALTSSRDMMISDKFISASSDPTTSSVEKKITSQRSSLLDQMLAEDEHLESPKTKEMISSVNSSSEPAIKPNIDSTVNDSSLAIVPIKKQANVSSGLFKKLLWRKRKGSGKKKVQLTFSI